MVGIGVENLVRMGIEAVERPVFPERRSIRVGRGDTEKGQGRDGEEELEHQQHIHHPGRLPRLGDAHSCRREYGRRARGSSITTP